jgi:hypothetical protein
VPPPNRLLRGALSFVDEVTLRCVNSSMSQLADESSIDLTQSLRCAGNVDRVMPFCL